MSRTRIRFETLVQQASQEPLPAMDVADRVLASIGQDAQPHTAERPIWQAAGVSVMAAAAVLMLAAQQGALFEDPLAHWLRFLVLVMR